MSSDLHRRNIVIIGGGIIGSTTAYFLSHNDKFDRERDRITLLEATKIAGGASGKAGGLLALWAYPSCLVPLSYRLHKELADKHEGAERWGYRALYCGQIDARGRLHSKPSRSSNSQSVPLQKRSGTATSTTYSTVPNDLDWIDRESLSSYEEMGNPSTTAQIHPFQFTTSMASLAEEKGVNIIFASAISINQASGAVKSVTYRPKDGSEEKKIEADTVVLTAGPWTKTVWPSAPISALRAHSVTIRPSRPVSAYALFTSVEIPKGDGRRSKIVTPEIYARPNNEVYACGEGDTLVPLPAATDLVQVEASRCEEIVQQVGSISDELRDGEVTARQACYLPNVTPGGGPMIGETEVKGLLMGAGHTCWGIQNAPGTGKCLSELVWDGGVKSANLSSLDPKLYIRRGEEEGT
ncbi:FAD dependent oxidoreductase [Lindgomyces ingoldianus]|uniref:FAD dependent oxidoreductase n=1 Tax=Lindgomyces ingoldianus TaxID=673940 RepID=A0ACB6QXM3_9PLEO|nr:FAD dependent oxidoreductase [Lindgomyces ingoldianus]KAF2471265.1 FAD dependent oxidoreductase [Lindgomyces ingoldianus]